MYTANSQASFLSDEKRKKSLIMSISFSFFASFIVDIALNAITYWTVTNDLIIELTFFPVEDFFLPDTQTISNLEVFLNPIQYDRHHFVPCVRA